MDTSTVDTKKVAFEHDKERGVRKLIVRRITLRAWLRVAWLRRIWEDDGNSEGNPTNYHRTIDSILLNKDNSESSAVWIETQKDLKALQDELYDVEKALEQDQQSFFALFRMQLGINRQESDLLQLCLAQAIKPDLARVYAYLQDHSGRPYVTDTLYRAFFDHTDSKVLSAASPLKLWNLVQVKEFGNGQPPMYCCDPHIVDRMMGKTDMDTVLLGIAHMQQPKPALNNWPLEQTLRFISRSLENNPSQRINICVSGIAGSGRKTFAAVLCQRLNLSMMVLEIDRIPEGQWNQVYTHAQRHAYLEACALCWTGKQDDAKKWPKPIPPFQIQLMICEPDEHVETIAGAINYRVDLPTFTIKERRQLWKEMFPQSATWETADFEVLVERHQLTIGQITQLSERGITNPKDAEKWLNESYKHRFGKLARYLKCPFLWDDLIVKDTQKDYLADFIFEAREREQLWENQGTGRLFPQGKGLMALFSGPPGTGKTMAAQVIAASLGLDLYRIDLSTIISKYVGETSKNIERILSKAGKINAVLLFDEADALFGKRTDVKDAHDRYANTDTNYLLQAIEEYSGIAVLATNKKANIDPGFLRRLRYVIEFPKPDAEQRRKLWLHLLNEMAGSEQCGKLEGQVVQLAKMVNVTGAQIKFSILSALFMSRKLNTEIEMPHLLAGLERELSKEGRTLGNEVKRKFISRNHVGN